MKQVLFSLVLVLFTVSPVSAGLDEGLVVYLTFDNVRDKKVLDTSGNNLNTNVIANADFIFLVWAVLQYRPFSLLSKRSNIILKLRAYCHLQTVFKFLHGQNLLNLPPTTSPLKIFFSESISFSPDLCYTAANR